MNELSWKTIGGLLASIIVALLMLALLLVSLGVRVPTFRQNASPVSSDTYIPGTKLLRTPVLLYTEDLGSGSVSGEYERGPWKLWKKVGSSSPELLITLGERSANQNLRGYSLSPDKKHLAVNIGTEVDIVNLDVASGEISSSWSIPDAPSAGAFSPDSKKVAIATKENGADAVHVIDPGASTDTILFKNSNATFDSVDAWRTDGKMMLRKWGEKDCDMGVLSYFSPEDNQIHPVPKVDYQRTPFLSADGMRMAVEAPSPDALSFAALCGDSTDFYKIYDPVIPTPIATDIGIRGEEVAILGFSPDKSQVLLSATSYVATSTGQYELSTSQGIKKVDLGQTDYYIQTLSSHKLDKVADVMQVYSDWSIDTTGARQDYDMNNILGITRNGALVATSTNWLTIVGQYWQ